MSSCGRAGGGVGFAGGAFDAGGGDFEAGQALAERGKAGGGVGEGGEDVGEAVEARRQGGDAGGHGLEEQAVKGAPGRVIGDEAALEGRGAGGEEFGARRIGEAEDRDLSGGL